VLHRNSFKKFIGSGLRAKRYMKLTLGFLEPLGLKISKSGFIMRKAFASHH
jgi:hypothetical protein